MSAHDKGIRPGAHNLNSLFDDMETPEPDVVGA